MQLRLSSCIGLPVVENTDLEAIGTLSGILIHPDTAKIEGFFVHGGGIGGGNLFLSALDIQRFSTRVYVRDADMVSPAEDRVRLQPLLEDGRTVLGQKIKTECGQYLGKCMDVQFNTAHFLVEWLFPKHLWRWGIAIPVTEILEVRRDAIIVRNPTPVAEELQESPPLLPQIPDIA